MPLHKNPLVPGSQRRRAKKYLLEAFEEEKQGTVQREAIRLAAIAWLADLCAWDIFSTLTYDPARIGFVVRASPGDPRPPSADTVARHHARWVDQLAFRLQRDVVSVSALEYTREGWPHLHGLVSMGGCDPNVFTMASAEWFSRYGFAHFERVDTSAAGIVAAYCTKYFTKGEGEFLIRGSLPKKIVPGQRWLRGL